MSRIGLQPRQRIRTSFDMRPQKIFRAAATAGCLSFLFFPAPPVLALTVESDAFDAAEFFGITFPGDTRAYYGRVDAILSVSKQEYRTTTFNVLEINIANQGEALVRIYHARPLDADDLAEGLRSAADGADVPGGGNTPDPPKAATDLADRLSDAAKGAAASEVFKAYPTATHAGTIEYHVADRDELLEFFDAFRKRWLGLSNTNGGDDSGRAGLGGTEFILENE